MLVPFEDTIKARLLADPAFKLAIVDEIAELRLIGDFEAADRLDALVESCNSTN